MMHRRVSLVAPCSSFGAAVVAATLLCLVVRAAPLAAQTEFRSPLTELPRCAEMCSAAEIRPFFEARAGAVECSLVVGLHVDHSGRVYRVEIVEPDENPGCNQAAEKWARSTRWFPARNAGGKPVPTFIAQPMTYAPLDA
jgi:TonB family protein